MTRTRGERQNRATFFPARRHAHVGATLELLDDGCQIARSNSKLLCRLERLRLQLELNRRQLQASQNSLELDLNVHERIVDEKECVVQADSLRGSRA